jgi:hypothetical protein
MSAVPQSIRLPTSLLQPSCPHVLDSNKSASLTTMEKSNRLGDLQLTIARNLLIYKLHLAHRFIGTS